MTDREHPECPNCICGKRASVQASFRGHPSDRKGHRSEATGSIAWSEHEEVWARYAARYGREQSAERINERGGFYYDEIVELLGREPETWAPAGAIAERERRG